MPNILDLRGKRISQTYKRVVQIDDNKFYDGEGNLIIDLTTLQNPPSSQNGVAVYNEVPTGTQNATNLIFTTAHTFVVGSTKLYRNGLRLKIGNGNDYLESNSNRITFINPPFPTDNLLIEYEQVGDITSKCNELLIGVQDDTNLIFSTPDRFIFGTTKLYRNGLRLRIGNAFDYVESGTSQITFNRPPFQTDNILIDYQI